MPGSPRYLLMYMRSYLAKVHAHVHAILPSWWSRVHAHVHAILPGGPECMLMYMRSYLVVQGACSCTCDHTWWSRVHAHVHAILPGGPGCMLMYMWLYLAKVHAHVHAIIPGGPGCMLMYMRSYLAVQSACSSTCDHTWRSRVHAHILADKGRWHCRFLHDSLLNCKGLQTFALWDLELETDLTVLGSVKPTKNPSASAIIFFMCARREMSRLAWLHAWPLGPVDDLLITGQVKMIMSSGVSGSASWISIYSTPSPSWSCLKMTN